MKSVNNLEDYFFGETNEIPNNPLLPLIIYRAVIKNFENLATQFEKIFYVNHWKPTWRFGIYDFPHYHSNAHEVIGVYRGRAKVLLGHRRCLSTWLKPGDVVVIPAGGTSKPSIDTRFLCRRWISHRTTGGYTGKICRASTY